MQRIGLTGGIGSGKTTVARLFETLGVSVFYADLEAHRIRMQSAVNRQIVQHFGATVLTENKIDKQKLANLIFSDYDALQWLNNLLHPLVKGEFERWCEMQKTKKSTLVMMESALIFEAKFEHLFDKIIVVDAPEELRIARVMNRENIPKNKVLQRMQNQISAEEKCKKANIIIHNDERHSLIEQACEIVKQILIELKM